MHFQVSSGHEMHSKASFSKIEVQFEVLTENDHFSFFGREKV